MFSIILDLELEIVCLCTFLGLAMHHWNLDFVHVVLVAKVDSKAVIHFEFLTHRALMQDLELTERNEM